jgi:hypothetical protein
VLAAPVKNVVLVHGAFVDGSGWKPGENDEYSFPTSKGSGDGSE